MREIKFRAWDKIGKCWLQSKLIQDFLTVGVPDDPKEGVFDIHDYRTNRIAIMQYTGLKDATGREIYEGDYILGMMYQAPAVVMYDQRYCCHKAQIGTRLISLGYECKVIGNIYENPELVEQSKGKTE